MKTKTILLICTLLFCIGGGKLYAQTTETEIYITSEKELWEFAAAVNGGTYGKVTAYLTTDIDMTEVNWTPIGSKDYPFKGHFEGWGHVIRNLSVSGNGNYAGLFGHIDGGSVRDVGVEGSNISGVQYVGSICGYLGDAGGEISSCYSDIAVSGTSDVGGLCGYSNGGVIKNCWHKGNVEGTATTNVNVGGLVGCTVNASLQCCYVYNTTITVKNSNDNSYFGLIVGQWNSGTDGEETINNVSVPKNLEYCFYESGTVKVSDFNSGNDIVVGSEKGGSSPTLKSTVMGAATAQMRDDPDKSNFFWEKGTVKFLNQESVYSNKVWRYVKDNNPNDGYTYDYPKLNSFYKNENFSLTFTDSKHWFSLVPNGNYTLPDGVKAYQVTSVVGTSVDGGSAILQPTPGDIIYEGCPILLYCESTGEDVKEFISTISNLSDYATWQSNNLLKGSPCSPDYIGASEDPNSYANETEDNLYNPYTDYVLKDGEFCIAGPGPIARGKAYLRLPTSGSNSANLRFVIQDDDASSIQSVERSVDEEGVWYTLDGRKLEGTPTGKGVYIYNGKKIMIQ